MRYIDNTPSAAPLLASLRDIGYTFETAVEDILDNCITAKATEIKVDFSWNDGLPWMIFQDNGVGMDLDELIVAMRPGSKSPINDRNAEDLGRFGLGLKTASFSQCKELTVISSKNGNVCAAKTDLDEIIYNTSSSFQLALLDQNDIADVKEIKDRIDSLACGTIVLWKKMDRIDSFDNKKNREFIFENMISQSRSHVELTFHRYLSPLAGELTKKIKIFFNGSLLIAYDPFNARHSATRELPEKIVYLEGYPLQVQAYILPHHSKLSPEDYNKYFGNSGYLGDQGFYIYRNKRLITKGTWFNLISRQELTKLVRVRLDIPNSLDEILKVNVMKSSILLPKILKDQLKVVISQIEDAGQRVYRQRGSIVRDKIKESLWLREASSGKIKYTINRKHSLIQDMSVNISESDFSKFLSLLSFLESSFPSQSLYVDAAKNPKELTNSIVERDKLKKYIGLYMDQLINKNDNNVDRAIEELFTIDPFASNRVITKEILIEGGFINE